MRTGCAMLVALTALGAVAGVVLGRALGGDDASFFEPAFPFAGGFLGGLAGLGAGLGIAYVVGRRGTD